jgi:DNA-binding transcriptional LysR family regulator
MKGVRGGRLQIGVVSTAKYFAPRLLTHFRARHAGVEIRLGVHNRGIIVRQLADNEIDLAIMGRPPQEFETVAEAFAPHPLVIIAAADHPLAGKRKIEPADLANETFLIREPGSGTRSAMERFFADVGFTPGNVFEMGSNETIKQAVMAGMGITFISGHTIALEQAVGRLVQLPVRGTPVLRQWYVVHRAEKELLPIASAFRDFLLAEGPEAIARAASADDAAESRRPPTQKARRPTASGTHSGPRGPRAG